ncbi:MAG: hypothetical protein NVSMB32_17700 [Actinomycetota bacterium]
MRWDNLLAEPDEAEGAPGHLFSGGTVIRRFKTPQFAGMTFYEIAAKTIVNSVPGTRYGFNWTINPYRGCSHACSYCAAGDTPVLMADGRTRPLAEVRPGDAIYGTAPSGDHRRYVTTRVLDHWCTDQPAHRLTLKDGRQLVTSGDHRFLTSRGWMPVMGAPQGTAQRPHLTPGTQLMGSPGITGEARVEGRAVTGPAALAVVSVEPLGVVLPLYDITTGTGDFIANGVVSHNCFARPTHSHLEFDAGRDFETKIVVKVNAAELLRRELRRRPWKGELIAMGTNTDPYQRAEGHYQLMRGILTELNAARNPYSILTKGTLIQRDLDLLREGAGVTEVSANFSVGTVDEAVWAATEPGTPHPMKRLEVVKMLNEAGVPCGVLMAPILPGISDAPKQLEATVKAAAAAGATHVTPITLHLRPGVKEEFMPWLAEQHPELVDRYTAMYLRSDAPKEVVERIGRSVADLRRRYGVTKNHATGDRDRPAPPAGKPPKPPTGLGGTSQQLSLDLGLGGAAPRRAPRPLATAPAKQKIAGGHAGDP